MTLPSNEFTWQFNLNQAVTGATVNDGLGQMMLALKNSLIGFASSPWTVVGSSNGTTSAFDGVDRWSSTSIFGWTAGTGVRPWIVLEQAGMGGLQLMFSGPKTSNTFPTMYWAISPSGSFSGGNTTPSSITTNMPSAPDEQVLLNNTSTTANQETRNILHVWQSQNGACSRWAMFTPTTAKRFTQVCMLETVKNPTNGWTLPYYFYFGGVSGTSSPNPGLSNMISTNGFGIYNDTKYAMGLTWEGAYNLTPIHRSTYGNLNLISGEYDYYKIGVASSVNGMRGQHGSIYDSWWGPGVTGNDSANTTSPYFSTSTWQNKNYIQIDELVWPWDGSSDMTII